MASRRPHGGGSLAGIVALTVFLAACSHSTEAQIRRLDQQERQLRASVDALEQKQATLRAEILQARAEADRARCHAEQEGYRAVVASVFAQYATRVAEHKGCKAKKARGGGALAVLGCGLAAFATGGVALALCGGGAALGLAVSETGCADAPREMTPEDVRQIAATATGMAREPKCGPAGSSQPSALSNPSHFLPSPYGGNIEAPRLQPVSSHHAVARDSRSQRRLERQRARFLKKQARKQARQ